MILSWMPFYQFSSGGHTHATTSHQGLTAEPARGMRREGKSLIRYPLPQKDARQRPMIAMATTEHAGGTA